MTTFIIYMDKQTSHKQPQLVRVHSEDTLGTYTYAIWLNVDTEQQTSRATFLFLNSFRDSTTITKRSLKKSCRRCRHPFRNRKRQTKTIKSIKTVQRSCLTTLCSMTRNNLTRNRGGVRGAIASASWKRLRRKNANRMPRKFANYTIWLTRESLIISMCLIDKVTSTV